MSRSLSETAVARLVPPYDGVLTRSSLYRAAAAGMPVALPCLAQQLARTLVPRSALARLDPEMAAEVQVRVLEMCPAAVSAAYDQVAKLRAEAAKILEHE
jgi:hypothetical protein